MHPEITVIELKDVLVQLLQHSVDRVDIKSTDKHKEGIIWRLYSAGWVHFPTTDRTYTSAVLTQSGANLAIKLRHRVLANFWRDLDNAGSIVAASLPFDLVCDIVCSMVEREMTAEMVRKGLVGSDMG